MSRSISRETGRGEREGDRKEKEGGKEADRQVDG